MGVGEDVGTVRDGQGGSAAAAAGVVLGFESGNRCGGAGVSLAYDCRSLSRCGRTADYLHYTGEHCADVGGGGIWFGGGWRLDDDVVRNTSALGLGSGEMIIWGSAPTTWNLCFLPFTRDNGLYCGAVIVGIRQTGKAQSASQWLEASGAALYGDGGGGYVDASVGGRADTGYDESAGWRTLRIGNASIALFCHANSLV